MAEHPAGIDRILIGGGFALGLLPLVLLSAIQLLSGNLLTAREYLAAAAGVTAIGVAGLRVGVRLFGRESILTR